MFVTVFNKLKTFGFHEESYRLEQGTYSCNFLFNTFDGFLGLESVNIKNKSVLFDDFLKLGIAIKFNHEWKYLKCSSKTRKNLLLKTVKFLFDSSTPSSRDLEFEWHLATATSDPNGPLAERWTNKIDVMNFDFDSTYILLIYHTKENYMALTTQNIFSNKLKELNYKPVTINDFSFDEITVLRLTIFSRPKLIEIEDRFMYQNVQVVRP
jgi:hypothetical protein